MREDLWYKMLIVSIMMHAVVLVAFSFSFKSSKKISILTPYYSVGLVGDVGHGGGGGRGAVTAPEKKIAEPAKKIAEPKKAPAAKEKLAPLKKDTGEVSLSKKRGTEKAKPSKQELTRLEDRLRELRKSAGPIDVGQRTGTGSGSGGVGGFGTGGGGGGRPLDPALERYINEIWEKISNAWRMPSIVSTKKDLQTIVTVSIRRDGRIVEVHIEERSGNRLYDESILRVLRNVDPFPPIPQSIGAETLELGFRFLPEGRL